MHGVFIELYPFGVIGVDEGKKAAQDVLLLWIGKSQVPQAFKSDVFRSSYIKYIFNMKLAYWMYAGPAHIGTLRVASSFKNVHAIMHAPLGDDYFNVMRSMLERERDFTPVTTSIVDRHVLARGSQEKVVENITRKDKEERPDLILLTPTCTSSILQEDLQ